MTMFASHLIHCYIVNLHPNYFGRAKGLVREQKYLEGTVEWGSRDSESQKKWTCQPLINNYLKQSKYWGFARPNSRQGHTQTVTFALLYENSSWTKSHVFTCDFGTCSCGIFVRVYIKLIMIISACAEVLRQYNLVRHQFSRSARCS